MDILNTTKKINLNFVLASKSPRRKQLLKLLGIDFEILPSDIDENISETIPENFALQLAEKKSIDIANKNAGKIIIGADTIVVLNNEIINKPENKDNAYEILTKLSGNTHQVITGICIARNLSGKTAYLSDFEKTDVTFRNLEKKEIIEYINTGSPMDKAGAYGIQDDFGAVFVSKINGCYYNIVGLPLHLLYLKLLEFQKNFL
jgi:septum formation protein